MSKKRIPLWLLLPVLALGGLLTFILGLFTYMSVTARPLHPDAGHVPSVIRSAPLPRWTSAVTQGQQIARAGLLEQNLPGLSVAVGIGGDVVWAEGFGWADIEARTRVTPDTRFRIGDASKALTSAGVGRLLEQNAINLDADIHAYVPAFPDKQWPFTLRQLMAQTAGITTDEGDEAPMTPCERTADGLRLVEKYPLRFEPGTDYFASAFGWILVSAAVEAAAGEPFFTFMRKEVFHPAGMTDTRPYLAAEPGPNETTFYFPRFAGDTRYGPEAVREGDHSCYAGGGAFLSTPSDLVRFGMALSSGTLLQPATVTMLQTPQRLRSGQETSYGLGWSLETVPLAGTPARMAGHGTRPDFVGGTTYLMTFPERGMVVAVTTNISFADTKSMAVAIANLFSGSAGSAAR